MRTIDVSSPSRPGAIAIIDDEDFEQIAKYKWHIRIDGYVARRRRASEPGTHRYITLHKFLLGAAGEVDHINNDKLDNRKENLRLCTRAENCRNSRGWSKTGYKGVTKVGSRYRATIMVNGQAHRLGMHSTPEAAHAAYCEAATRLHGQFANTQTNVRT